MTGDADCYTPDPVCGALSGSGSVQDCLTNLSSTTVVVAHQFLDDNNNPIDQPWDEIDNDGDNYVECDQFDLSTYRSGGGSFNVVAGLDCDDYDAFVYPTATEYCDGQFNNCEDVAYDAASAPTDEVDDDGDGFVECELTNGVAWAIDATNPARHCDGQCNDCDGSSSTTQIQLQMTMQIWTVMICMESVTRNLSEWVGRWPVGYGDCSDDDAATNGSWRNL